MNAKRTEREKKKGRPELTWAHGILQTLKERGLKDGTQEDCDGWRIAVDF